MLRHTTVPVGQTLAVIDEHRLRLRRAGSIVVIVVHSGPQRTSFAGVTKSLRVINPCGVL